MQLMHLLLPCNDQIRKLISYAVSPLCLHTLEIDVSEKLITSLSLAFFYAQPARFLQHSFLRASKKVSAFLLGK